MRVFRYITIGLLLTTGSAVAQRLNEMVETVRKQYATIIGTSGKVPANLQPLNIQSLRWAVKRNEILLGI
jgi:nicotinate-nucleotide pyrophosphorylase